MEKETNSKKETRQHVCSGCIHLFPESKLNIVTVKDYNTFFCDQCIPKEIKIGRFTKKDVKGNAQTVRREYDKRHPI